MATYLTGRRQAGKLPAMAHQAPSSVRRWCECRLFRRPAEECPSGACLTSGRRRVPGGAWREERAVTIGTMGPGNRWVSAASYRGFPTSSATDAYLRVVEA